MSYSKQLCIYLMLLVCLPTYANSYVETYISQTKRLLLSNVYYKGQYFFVEMAFEAPDKLILKRVTPNGPSAASKPSLFISDDLSFELHEVHTGHQFYRANVTTQEGSQTEFKVSNLMTLAEADARICINRKLTRQYSDSLIKPTQQQLESITELECNMFSASILSNTRWLKQLTSLTELSLDNYSAKYAPLLINLTALTSLNSLKIHGTYSPIGDIVSLSQLTSLTSLSLIDRYDVIDLNPLTNLPLLSSLTLSSPKISNLNPLTNVPSLTTLTLQQTDINALPTLDLSPLTNLPLLSTLELTISGLTDATHLLPKLSSLTTLNLSGNSDLTHFNVLNNLPSLAALNLRQTAIADISFLTHLPSLTHLNLRQSPVTDITPLINLPLLASLNLRQTPISSLNPLVNLSLLSSLYLSSNDQLTDLNPLVDIPSLTTLTLAWSSSTKIVASLPSLITLDLSNNDLTDSDINRLATLTSLSTLNLESNPRLTNISVLANLPLLTTLNLSAGYLKFSEGNIAIAAHSGLLNDISPLANLPLLASLNLSGQNITDFTPVKHVSNVIQRTGPY